jgi:type IV secretory pathway VirB2 component (pilin)
MMFSFQSGQLGHSTNTIILKSNEHKSYAWVFGVICIFQSSQFFDVFQRSR